jgi:hypothetical protein
MFSSEIHMSEPTLEGKVKKMLAAGYSDAYIEAVLYGEFSWKWSIQKIAESVRQQKEAMVMEGKHKNANS